MRCAPRPDQPVSAQPASSHVTRPPPVRRLAMNLAATKSYEPARTPESRMVSRPNTAAQSSAVVAPRWWYSPRSLRAGPGVGTGSPPIEAGSTLVGRARHAVGSSSEGTVTGALKDSGVPTGQFGSSEGSSPPAVGGAVRNRSPAVRTAREATRRSGVMRYKRR
jgi:hypothetical protein